MSNDEYLPPFCNQINLTPGVEYPICQEVMQGVVVPNVHFEGCLCSSIVCPYPFVPSTDRFIKHGLHEHTHITPWVSRNYQRQEYVMSLKGDTGGGEIKGDNKDGPTCVWGSHYSIRIEPIYCQRDMYITSLIYFVTMFVIKADPSFTIGWMYHLVRIVPFAIFVPCHLFHGFLGHV